MKTNIALLIFLLIIGLWSGVTFFGSHPSGATSVPFGITWRVASQAPLIFGVIPYGTDQALAQEFTPLSTYLRRHLGREVKLMVASSYKSLGRLLDSGDVEIARFSAIPYEMFNTANQWEVLCRPVVSGKVFSRGVIVTTAKGPILTLEALQGKHFAFVDPYSGTGCIKAKAFFQAKGIDPLTFFGRISFSGNHSASLNGLRTGLYDGAAVFENALTGSSSGSRVTNPGEEVRRLGFTEWILTDPIVIRKSMPSELKENLKDLFVNMKDREFGASVAAELKSLRNYDGFLAEEEIRNLLPPKE
ncbi:MAG: phosphate/phosphite/phosphonate ABC transporter substrate-binding protein [Candidatus Ozemobacteraceae bacterium]